MTNILDHFIKRSQSFQPKSFEDVLAIRLAQRLGDERATERYSALLSEYSTERVLAAYRRAIKAGANSDLVDRFHAEVRRGNGRMISSDDTRLIAVKVERRSVAAAVFVGKQLEFTDIRHLSSQLKRAEASAVQFVSSVVSNLDIQSAAMESLPSDRNIRRTSLTASLIERSMQSPPLPLWRLPKTHLFQALAYPALRSRKELRNVIFSMWPVLQEKPRVDQALDAVALGVVVQTERLLLN